jgi:hypothetical protein
MIRAALLTLILGSPALAVTPAQLADQAALSARAVRAPCPAQLPSGSECATADYDAVTVRSVLSIDLRDRLTAPWRQLGPDAVSVPVSGLTLTLYTLSEFRTLLAVSGPPVTPGPPGDVRMLFGARGAAAAQFCRFTPEGDGLTRITCTYPSGLTLYSVVRLP